MFSLNGSDGRDFDDSYHLVPVIKGGNGQSTTNGGFNLNIIFLDTYIHVNDRFSVDMFEYLRV